MFQHAYVLGIFRCFLRDLGQDATEIKFYLALNEIFINRYFVNLFKRYQRAKRRKFIRYVKFVKIFIRRDMWINLMVGKNLGQVSHRYRGGKGRKRGP